MDLTKPEYKGKQIGQTIAPSGGTTWTRVMFERQVLGEDYWKKQAATEVVLFPSGAPAADALVRGEISIVPSLYNIVFTKQRDGAPVEIVFAPEGMPINPYAAGIPTTAKNPNAAKLFLNWCLSVEGQTFMIKEQGNLTSLKVPPVLRQGLRPEQGEVLGAELQAIPGAARGLDRGLEQDLQLPPVAVLHGEVGDGMSAALSVSDLRKQFSIGRPAVDGVSFHVAAGEIVVLLGPSGCGKTTTLRCVAGLEHATAGRISIGAQVVSAPARRRAGAAAPAQHRHGVPVLRGVAAHDGAPERRLSAAPSHGSRAARSTARSTRCWRWSA